MNLKEYRRIKGLTQEEVASHLGIPKKTYQNYEREVREPSTDVLCALADLYNTTLDELTGRDWPADAVQNLSSGEFKLIEAYRSASDTGQRSIETTARALADEFPRDADGF